MSGLLIVRRGMSTARTMPAQRKVVLERTEVKLPQLRP